MEDNPASITEASKLLDEGGPIPSDPSKPVEESDPSNTREPFIQSRPVEDSPSPFLSARIVSNVFEAQLVLAGLGFSPGSMDGVLGSQTRAALERFQRHSRLPVTGQLDSATKSRLILKRNPIKSYTVTESDIRRIMIVPPTWLGKSKLDRLDYESVLELVAEKHATHPSFIKQLNPGIDWDHITADTSVKVPNTELPPPMGKVSEIRIDLSDRILEAYDSSNRLMAVFPCSIARRVEKRPQGQLRVTKVAENPNYRFDPEIFSESPEAKSIGKPIMIPPGPNNPVGTAWISLSLPAYGIHGTPNPEAVGRTESHGCFRLANWNADYLVRAVEIGTPVLVQP